MKLQNAFKKYWKSFITSRYLPYGIISFFSVFYATLSLKKHYDFLSGYDLAIIDQVIWKYSQFKNPITTVHAYHGTSTLADHVELIYILLSPFYWIFNSAYLLLLLQVFAITVSGLAIYKLARLKKLTHFVSIALLISYLLFYGFQNAIWADVHSLLFAVFFLAWFIYFLEKGRFKLSLLFFILSIICKEDIALLTFLISFVCFTINRKKQNLIFILLSILYLIYIFFIYYPYFTQDGYRYANPDGIIADINPYYMIDTAEKKEVIAYSLGWFGFLPLLSPFYLIPAVGDLAHYFILGKSLVTSAQGLFLHYRSSLALLLVWPTIITISKYKKLNKPYMAIYLLGCAFFFQYYLHLPLSYLSKPWFWNSPAASNDIRQIILQLPKDSSVASQNNITPHITHRDEVYTLWPDTKDFLQNSPCKNQNCLWFRWGGNPDYIIVDTSEAWDARHFLTNREQFKESLRNLEISGIIKEEIKINNAVLYKIIKQP